MKKISLTTVAIILTIISVNLFSIPKVSAVVVSGTAAFSSGVTQKDDSYTFSVTGSPANTKGTLYKQIGSGNWVATPDWITTDSSGNATKGPWTCTNGIDDLAIDVYIKWPDGSITSEAQHSCNYSTAAAGQGTFTISVKIGKANSDTPPSVISNVVDLFPGEDSYFSYDIGQGVGTGMNAKVVTVLTDVKINHEYSLPAGSYIIIFKSQYKDYDKLRRGGNFDLPYYLNISANQHTDLEIPYYVYPDAPLGAKGSGILVHFKGDIVDYKGTHVRDLTPDEISQVQFDVKLFDSTQNFGGPTGAYDNAGRAVEEISYPAKLKDYPDVPGFRKPMSNSICYRMLDIKNPTGYSLYGIGGSVGEGGTWGSAGGNMFCPPYVFTQEIREKYKDLLAEWYLKVPDMTVVFHFTQLGSSQMQKKDFVQFVASSGSGLDFVKRITQTYSDREGLYLEVHDDFRVAKNGNGNKPFPVEYKVAVFNNKPYLFLNALSRIQIYDISSPSSPRLVDDFNLATSLPFSEIKGVDPGFTSPWPEASKMFITDNSPYVLVQLAYAGYKGAAILRLDTEGMTLSGDTKLTSISDGSAIGQYKSSSGKTYFVAMLPSLTNQAYAIFSANSDGSIEIKKTLQAYPTFTQGNYVLKDFSIEGAKIENIGTKNYMFVPISKTQNVSPALKIVDITDPSSISIVASIDLSDNISPMAIDKSTKRIYLGYASYSTVLAGKIDVYDISTITSPKKISTFSDVFDLIKLSDSSQAVVEMKKRLNIPSSQKIIDAASARSTGYWPIAFTVSDGIASISISRGINLSTDPLTSGAYGTEYSDYATQFFQFFVNVKDLSAPKILGMMLSRQIISAATGSGLRSVEENSGNCYNLSASFAVVYRGRYLYRSNCRTADLWEFKNIAATAAPTGGGGGGTGGGTGGGGTSGITSPAPTTFNFNSLLQIFRRILKK